MPFGGPNSERALILAPRGRDAEIASALFQEAGWATLICADIGRLCEEFPKGAAFAVVAEEAIERKIYLLSFRRLPQPACRRVLVERAFLIVFTPWPEHKI